MKERPIYRIKPTRSIVAYTWCGVEPYRRGIRTEDPRGDRTATCKACLAEEAKAQKTAKVRHPIKATKMGAAPVESPLAKAIDALIGEHGVDTVLMEIRGYVYGRIDGSDTAWETIYEVLVDATRKVREIEKARKVTNWSADETH